MNRSRDSAPADRLYAQPLEAISDFVFDRRVVEVFADMIRRSVPGYGTLLSMLPVMVGHFVQAGSRCYDLGCSQGACALAIQQSVTVDGVHIVAVDNSPDMVASARSVLQTDAAVAGGTVELRCEDVLDTPIEQASLVVMNFTLQFIDSAQRQRLIDKIHDGLKPGGALLLSEKIQQPAPHSRLMTALHEEFKRANGYSELEISQKRSALENVLVADTLAQHRQRLQQAGFEQVLPWFQCFNFYSLLAVK